MPESSSKIHSVIDSLYYDVDFSHFHKLSSPLTEDEKIELVEFGRIINPSQLVRYCALLESSQNHMFFTNKWPVPTALVVLEPARNYFSVFANENTREILNLLKIENSLLTLTCNNSNNNNNNNNGDECDDDNVVDEACSSCVRGYPRKPFHFASVSVDYAEIFEEKLKSVNSTQVIDDCIYDTLQLQPTPERFEQAVNLLNESIGSNTISPLTLEDVEMVDSTWAYSDHFSKEYVRLIILNHPTACIRVNGNPVSWGVLHADLSVGIMYTLKEYRGKGLGGSVAAWLSLCCLQKLKISPYCHVARENHASAKMFKKLGFVKSEEVKWIMGIPFF